MTAPNYRSNREGILLPRVIECPVCGERAHSFRIRRVVDLLTVEAEFYHRTATCAGSMTPDMPTAMDLLRLAVEEAAKRPELPVQVEWSRDGRAIGERSRTFERAHLTNGT
jgi:hypothetical protein